MTRAIRFAASSLILTALLAVAACNTVKGAGKDAESVGGHIEHAADNNGAK